MDGLAHGPGEVAEIVSQRVEGDLHRLTGAALAARARRLAGALGAGGLRRGDQVAMLAWNGHRAVELALACADTGICLVAVDPDQHPDAIARVVDAAGASIIFFDLSFMPLVESIAPRLATARCSVVLLGGANMPGPAALPHLLCYEDGLGTASEGAAAVVPAEEAARFELLPRDVVLAAEPMYRRAGFNLVQAALATPVRRLVLPGPWLDGRSLHQMIEGEGVTVVAAVPVLWQRLLAHVEREDAGLAGLERALVTGGPAIAAPVARTLRDRYGVGGLEITRSPLHEWGAEKGAGAGSVALNEAHQRDLLP